MSMKPTSFTCPPKWRQVRPWENSWYAETLKIMGHTIRMVQTFSRLGVEARNSSRWRKNREIPERIRKQPNIWNTGVNAHRVRGRSQSKIRSGLKDATCL